MYTTSTSGETVCTSFDTFHVDSAPLVPPFTYNNQCGSVVLTSYIPVLLMGYSIQLFLPFIMLAFMHCVSYESMWPSFRKTLHGIIWPEYWLQGKDDMFTHNKAIVQSNSIVMLNIRTIFCNDVFNNLLVMLTFGLCSPVLAVAVAVAVLLKMSVWVLLIGRFTMTLLAEDKDDISCDDTASSDVASTVDSVSSSQISQSISTVVVHDEMVHFFLIALAEMHISLYEILAGSFWRLVWCSALFVALLSWDMAMDEVGWLQSVWVPLVPLGYAVGLRLAAFFGDFVNDSRISVSKPEETEMKVTSPFHVQQLMIDCEE